MRVSTTIYQKSWYWRQCKGSYASSIKSSEADEERMKPGQWMQSVHRVLSSALLLLVEWREGRRNGWCPWFTWPDWARPGMICHPQAWTRYYQPTYQIWSLYLRPLWRMEKGY